jgi:hypothetical protein
MATEPQSSTTHTHAEGHQGFCVVCGAVWPCSTQRRSPNGSAEPAPRIPVPAPDPCLI